VGHAESTTSALHKLLAALLVALFLPALAFAEGHCSTVHMVGSTGEYVFKDMSVGWEVATKLSDGIRKPGGHLYASGVLLRMDGKPLPWHESLNLTRISCEHDFENDERLNMVSKGIKCKLLKAYVYDSFGNDGRCYLDLDEIEFDMKISLLGITGESTSMVCANEHLDINLRDRLVIMTHLPNGTANCKVEPYTLQLSQVPKEREY
jgi:hypothetical protein